MELLFVGTNTLLVMAIWHFMLRPTILDHSRDRLFDLRDELRETFVSNGWDMSSPLYKRLRDLVNGYLRFTEEVSLFRMTYVTQEVKKNAELLSYVHHKNAAMFAVSNEKQKAFVQHFRRRSLMVVMDYAIFSSGLLLLLALALLPFVFVQKFFAMINRKVDFTIGICISKVGNARQYISLAMMASIALVGRWLMLPDLVESYSLRRGTPA
jgi:hypothetical protein